MNIYFFVHPLLGSQHGYSTAERKYARVPQPPLVKHDESVEDGLSAQYHFGEQDCGIHFFRRITLDHEQKDVDGQERADQFLDP